MLKLLVLLLCACVLLSAQARVQAGDRLPLEHFRAGRSVVLSPNGMVATSQPLAAQAGLDVLRQGGNAIDAAIAANAAIGLTEPMSCGIGGDLFAIVWDAKSKKLFGLNAAGRSPYRASRELFAKKGLTDIPSTGPLSWSVPGCVDGWHELSKRFGSMPLSKVLEPSIQYAEKGFPVTEVIAGHWRSAESLFADSPEGRKTYLNAEGKSPRFGELYKNPYLAHTYRVLAKEGPAAFYQGELADKMVAWSEKQGGLFTKKDFVDHKSVWVEPVSTNYRGYDVWALPPPGQGISVLQMLNVLSAYDLKKLGPTSPDYWHLLVEAKKLAYADRAKFYTDPAFAKLPTAELISLPYAEKRRSLLDMKKALTNIPAGDPKLGQSDTIYLTVVDKDRNCVSLIQSNYFGFGSGIVADDLGFALQNRGTLFALDDKHLNRLEPHKLPFHTIIPAFVTEKGQPRFVFGVMGGDMQPQGQVQVLINLLDFGMNVQEAGEAPRVQHLGSATPTGKPGDDTGGVVELERGVPDSIAESLMKRGHRVVYTRRNGGGYQGIWIDAKTNMLHGGSEARKDGCAVGY